MDDFKENIVDSDLEDIFGQEGVKKELKSALVSDRHLILVGEPGIGKTTLAKNVSKLLPSKELSTCDFRCDPDNPICPQCRSKKRNGEGVETREYSGEELFVRIQGSPDLTAEDMLGDIDPIKAIEYGPLSLEAFTPGKIFRAHQGVLFFDEINRCSEKLQNALLQALEENQVTIGSYLVDFDVDFIFIGTMNPEDVSTEPLSDVFLDRFDLIHMNYPESLETEVRIVREKGKDLVDFSDDLLQAVMKFVRDLREDDNVEKKPSVRASIGLYERAQANARVDGREKVNSQDVADAVVSVLAHRMSLKPSVKYLKSVEDYVEKQFESFSENVAESGEYL